MSESGRTDPRTLQKGEVAVHFLVGGTQANLTVISALLRPHQAAVCVETGHINVHETGAIEAVGHKVISVPGKNGKLTAEDVERVYRLHWEDATHEHMPQPKLVYISNPTEIGTIYTKAELEALRAVCDRCGLYLFWMEQGWDMVWQRRIMIWIWKALRQTVMCFISEGRKWEHSSERPL